MMACAACAPLAMASQAEARLPLSQETGGWPTGHVQGIAVDVEGGYIYYSFTNLLAKYDFSGRLVGTLVGWRGHLGDIAFNAADGRIYGSLEYKRANAFYAAVLDVSRLDRVGMVNQRSGILRTVHLAEVASDYAQDMDGDGKFDGDTADTPDHRYGTSGIDGVSFGPAFGKSEGKQLFTVGYGIYRNTARSDNDHQVILQYDVSVWDSLLQPLDEDALHRSGPDSPHGKYFVRTGNTTYGVQNLAWDQSMKRWFLGVYAGRKEGFPNYTLFAIDAMQAPTMADLVGVPGADGTGWEQGLLLQLADDGLEDPATGIRGWHQKADVGFQPMGRGLFYIATDVGGHGWQGARLTLHRWTGDPEAPFVPVSGTSPAR
ncbi:hypothetical protein [Luteimonas sp. e5]